jgi:hypothetical protein
MTIAKLVARIAFAIGEATFVFNQFVKKCVEVFFISPSIDDTGRRPNLQLWRSTMAKQLFYDPFDGWGDLAAKLNHVRIFSSKPAVHARHTKFILIKTR